MSGSRRSGQALRAASLALGAMLVAPALSASESTAAEASPYIIQAGTAATAAELVREVGGEVTHEFRMIWSVAARLTPSRVLALKASHPEAGVHPDGGTEIP